MKKLGLLAALMLLSLMSVACAGVAGFSNETLRYKVTVVVETPEGVRTGSAVREAGKYREPSILPEQGGTFYNVTKGEAVVVDLGGRGVLFALLGGQEEARQLFKLFADKKDAGQIALTPEQYPQFVRFRNLKDPKTVDNVLDLERVGSGWPAKFQIKKDHTEEMFGAGVKIKAVSAEVTDEPVTRGVASKYMPSYAPQQEYLKWLRTLPYGDPRAINANDFGAVGGAQ